MNPPADPGRPGAVQRLPLAPHGAAAVCAYARSLGHDATRIDLAGCRDKREFLARTAAALDFPGWFGENWDAYYDCLADLGWRPAPGHLLVYERAAEFAAAAPEAFDTALVILGDAAAAWAARGIPFRVFVDA
jgi:hypothetical protein